MRTNWLRVRDVFERALEEQPADLDAWLAQGIADDADVLAEVRSLVDHHAKAGRFLTQPVSERFPALLGDEEAAAYEAGRVIGPYTIVRELGRGGMGRVYLASDERLGRPVALKAIAPRYTGDPGQRERLRREARAAAGLAHPGICTVYALEEYDGDLFIAAEYVDGRTLRDEIAAGSRPSAADVLRTARELAEALASAHARGIAHRDLKPENVMRTADGRVKILDFGLARTDMPEDDPAAIQVTEPGVFVGTPGYMAPEQLQGGPGDVRADVFAFGVLIYEIASGVHPFAASSTLGVAARILQSDAQPLEQLEPRLPAVLSDIIERCLKKSPGDRFGSAVEIASALAAPPHPRHEPVRGWWRTHQGVVIGLYFLASTLAWQIKEWQAGPGPALIFGFVGIAATAAGVFRGHLLFTERMNPDGLAAERLRTDRVTSAVDLLIAAALVGGAAFISTQRPLAAVLTAGLAVGIALGRLVVEPSTAAASFRRP